jgi:hypothetical protein
MVLRPRVAQFQAARPKIKCAASPGGTTSAFYLRAAGRSTR